MSDTFFVANRPKRLKEMAVLAGVAPITLRRWLLEGKVPEVSRDRNGWRIFNESEEQAVLKYALKTTPPQKKTKHDSR